MKDKPRANLLYGVDIFASSEMRSVAELTGFVNYSDVQMLSISDFFYSSFEYDDGDYILYDNEGASSFAYATVFTPDVSQLAFLTSNAVFDYKSAFISQPDREEYTFEVGEAPKDGDDLFRVSKKYAFPPYIKYMSTFYSVRANYRAGKLSVHMSFGDEKKISVLLHKFFSLTSQELRVYKSEDGAALDDVYTICMLRACIIALKAAIKYKSDIIYQFRPFVAFGALEIDDHLTLRKDNTTVVSRDLSVSYDMGKSSLHQNDMADEMKKAVDSLLSPSSWKLSLKILHDEVHSSTASAKEVASYIHLSSCYAFLQIAKVCNVTGDYLLHFCLDAMAEKDEAVREKIKSVDAFLDAMHYQFKDAIFRHNSSIEPPVSSMEFEAKKRISMLPVLVNGEVAICIINYNIRFKEILKMWFLLPDFQQDDAHSFTSYVSKSLCKYGFYFPSGFSTSDIHITSQQRGSGISPLLLASIFMKCFKLECEDL